MNKLEYDSFYKFMVSMGVILFVAPIIAFNYLISSPYDLHTTISALSELSPLAQQIIQIRQQCLYSAVRIAPIVCIVSSIIGIIFIFYGAVKWRTIQKKIDSKYDLENEHLKLSIIKMSEEDITKKVKAEINELEPETHDQNLQHISKSHSSQRLQKYLQIEESVSKYIYKRYYKTHEVDIHIRLDATEYDIIARARKWGTQDLIFEIKYIAKSPYFGILKQFSFKVLNLKHNYMGSTNRIPEAVLFIVIKDSEYEKCKQQIDQYFESNEAEDITVELLKESEIS